LTRRRASFSARWRPPCTDSARDDPGGCAAVHRRIGIFSDGPTGGRKMARYDDGYPIFADGFE